MKCLNFALSFVVFIWHQGREGVKARVQSTSSNLPIFETDQHFWPPAFPSLQSIFFFKCCFMSTETIRAVSGVHLDFHRTVEFWISVQMARRLQYNVTLLPSVNTLIARGMFCGAKYTHHTFTPIIEHLITTANYKQYKNKNKNILVKSNS